MGQFWEVYNIDDEEKWNGGKLGEFFWEQPNDYIPFMLTRPMWAEPYEEFAMWTQLPRHTNPATAPSSSDTPGKLSLPELPIDVILVIFDAIPNLVDAISLCLTTQHLGLVGERRVHSLLIESAAPWAGKRIVCLGQYTYDHDFPPSLQGHFDRIGVECAKSTLRAKYGPRTYEKDYKDYRFWYSTLACETYKSHRDIDTHPTTLYTLDNLYPRGVLAPSEKLRFHGKFMRRLARSCKQLGFDWPPTKTKVLCNLSKGEYVRERAVVKLFERLKSTVAHYSWNPVFELAQVLLSMISWSSDPSCAMACNHERLSRGPWAGDRFEITSIHTLRKGIVWKDVTADVLEWVEEIWKADFGLE